MEQNRWEDLAAPDCPEEDETNEEDLDAISELVVQYYNFASGNGGTPPDELLARPLTDRQRGLLRMRMEDVDVCLAFTAPLRAKTRMRRKERQTAFAGARRFPAN